MRPEDLIENGDWREAFAYAGDEDACCGNSINISRCEGATCSIEPISRREVVEVVAAEAGENDGASWLIVGRVKDGRYFYLEAGCDYTGWDCQSSGSCWVSEDLGNLIQFGVGEDERARLKIGDHAE